MNTRHDELETFKTNINLTEYAASRSYVLDRKSSSRNSVVMANGQNDKIVIARGPDRHWVYFSVRDDTDHRSSTSSNAVGAAAWDTFARSYESG